MIKIRVVQYLKPDIKDPEGGEVKKALVRLGFPVENVSIGREIMVDVDVAHVDEAKRLVEEMCQRILTNPILHDYSVEAVELWNFESFEPKGLYTMEYNNILYERWFIMTTTTTNNTINGTEIKTLEEISNLTPLELAVYEQAISPYAQGLDNTDYEGVDYEDYGDEDYGVGTFGLHIDMPYHENVWPGDLITHILFIYNHERY